MKNCLEDVGPWRIGMLLLLQEALGEEEEVGGRRAGRTGGLAEWVKQRRLLAVGADVVRRRSRVAGAGCQQR